MATNEMAAAWGQRRRKRLHVNKVRMALARKLLVGVWVMLSRGEVFELRRTWVEVPGPDSSSTSRLFFPVPGAGRQTLSIFQQIHKP
jgi:hypothetical protein